MYSCTEPYKNTFSGDPKMAAIFGFSMIGERVFLEDPKKYTFGKTIFKTFFKNRNSEILPPFLSTWHSWIDSDLDVFISADGGHVWWITLKGSSLRVYYKLKH